MKIIVLLGMLSIMVFFQNCAPPLQTNEKFIEKESKASSKDSSSITTNIETENNNSSSNQSTEETNNSTSAEPRVEPDRPTKLCYSHINSNFKDLYVRKYVPGVGFTFNPPNESRPSIGGLSSSEEPKITLISQDCKSHSDFCKITISIENIEKDNQLLFQIKPYNVIDNDRYISYEHSTRETTEALTGCNKYLVTINASPMASALIPIAFGGSLVESLSVSFGLKDKKTTYDGRKIAPGQKVY